jgi:hypothetical protein
VNDDPASTRLMTAPTRIVGAAGATVASAVVLATVRSGWLDAADGVVLVASLAVLARTAIRLASDSAESRHEPR